MLSYRSEAFNRIKPKNRELIHKASENGILSIKYKSSLLAVEKEHITLAVEDKKINLKNDLVYIFAGGELPTQFLEKAGVKITKRFGHTLKKYG
jgi:pyruvate/2-oxoglutarate dehydrogenase complex dihydrolipoamide dehydrogenase (E3) component